MYHIQQTRKALDFIENHLRAEIHAEDVAKEASFSTSHFHPIFSRVVGCTLAEYIRRRRLAYAAYDLAIRRTGNPAQYRRSHPCQPRTIRTGGPASGEGYQLHGGMSSPLITSMIEMERPKSTLLWRRSLSWPYLNKELANICRTIVYPSLLG